jgi:hypothetical protein
MDLFITPKLQFEKVAAEYALPEDPNAWSNEVLQELFKQAPYVADYEPAIVLDKVDAERGYGFGHVEVSNKTEIQPGATVAGLEAAGIKHVKIPILIKNRRLQPFDVMINETGEVLPLTEGRLRAAIFRPASFDITGKTPGDMSMVGQLYPPFRQNFGFGGGGGVMSAGMGKEGSAENKSKNKKELKGLGWRHAGALGGIAAGGATLGPLGAVGGGIGGYLLGRGADEKNASILEHILPTILPEHYEEFFTKIASSDMQAAYVANRCFTEPALKKLAMWEKAELPEPEITPTIVQISKLDVGYAVKTASHHFWAPKTETWDRGQVCKTFGTKIAMDVDMNGSMTMGLDEPKPALDTEVDKYDFIKEFGIYKCRTEDGKDIIGYVFPNLIDVDGTPLPLYLFTNGSEKAVQGDLVGINVGGGASLFEGPPRGTGCFYQLLPNGRAQATIPMTIVATLASPGESSGVTLHARTFDGRQIEVEVQPNIQKVLGVGDTKMLVPETMCWLPLDSAKDVSLLGDPDTADAQTKMASVNPVLTIEIRSSGPDSFSLSGLPIEKLASEQRNFLTFDEALFILGAAGADLKQSCEKLASALQWNATFSVQADRGIVTDRQMMESSVKVAAQVLSKIPDLRQDLVKEAAAIPDPTTVDTVLSLGFINPENISSFIAYLPKIDGAQKKMCELLLVSRLGLRDLPTSALEKAIRATEEVIQGLKVLAFQKA